MTITKIHAPHPSIYIRDEMESRGWNQRDLAFILGVTPQSINLLLNEKKGISADMAKMLGDAFDVSAELFLNLQGAYVLSKAKEPEKGVWMRGRVLDHYPLREMISRGWIEDTTTDLLEMQLCKFFQTSSLSDIPYLAHIKNEL